MFLTLHFYYDTVYSVIKNTEGIMVNIYNNKKPNVLDGISLYLDAGWGVARDYAGAQKTFDEAYKNSHFITAIDNDKLVGMIRYFTDGFHDTQIIECIVLKSYQKQGIAKAMLNELKELHPGTAIYIQSTENYKEAFIKEGFKKHQLVGLSFLKRG